MGTSILRLSAVSCAVVLSAGCASIVSGHNQSLSVVAKNADNSDVVGANCVLTNDKGVWYATTPGSVTVKRAYGDMSVSCKHAQSAGTEQAKSSTKGMVFGNILFGGIIGIGVDIATGAAYDYPDVIAVPMIGALPRQEVVPAPIAAVPVQAPTVIAQASSGQDSYQIERMGREQGCNPDARAGLTGKGPGFETYSLQCSPADVWSVRCEFGQCRVLR